MLPEKEGEGKLNAEEYCEQILDKDLFDFWLTSIEELGEVVVIDDRMSYHRGAALVRCKQYEKDSLLSWGLGIWPANSPDLNPLENL